MRKLLLAGAASVSMLLSSCATGPLTPDQIAQLTQQIQAYTAAACSFQPTAASVASLIAAFYSPAAPIVAAVNTIGDAICKAPVTKSAVYRGTVSQTRIVPTPKGPVPVRGTTY